MATKKKILTDEEIQAKLREDLRMFNSPAKQKKNDLKVTPLLEEYGLLRMADWCLMKRGPNLFDMTPLEIERLCVRGKIGRWDWALQEEFKLRGTAWEESFDFPMPTKEYPLFDYGNRGPKGHFKNLADLIWCGELKIEWNKKQGQTLVQNHFLQRTFWDITNRTQYCDDQTLYNMVAGPGSCGKTFGVSLRMLLMFYCFPRHCMGKVCSSSKSAAESRIWAEVIKWHDESIFGKETKVWGGYFKLWSGGSQRLLFVEDGEKANDGKKDARCGIELVAIPRSAVGKGAVGQLKGMRQFVKILIVDEATDVDGSVFDPEMAGNWLEAQFLSQIIYLANPNHDSGAFVEHYSPLEGQDYDPDSIGWHTKFFGYVTNLNGLDTPNRNWKHEKDRSRSTHELKAPFPYVTNITGIRRLEIRAGGRNTCAFMSQAVGFLSAAELADNILTEGLIRASGADREPEWTGDGVYTICANDPSFGGDDFASGIGEVGMGYVDIQGVRKKRVLLNLKSIHIVPIPNTGSEGLTREELSVDWVLDLCKMEDVNHLSAVASDSTGTSKGFVHLFESRAKSKRNFTGTHLHRVGWMEKCSERPEAPDDSTARPSCDAYPNSTSELIMAVRQYRHYLRGLSDPEMIDQFIKRKFHMIQGNRFKVQTKDEFIKGVKAKGWAPYGKSPDKMDMFAVMVDLARTMGLGTETLTHPSAIAEGGRLFARRNRRLMYGQTAQKVQGWTSIKQSA